MVIPPFISINTYMGKLNNTPVVFIETTSTKLPVAQCDNSGAFIHVHDGSDSDTDDILYIGKDRITDKLNVGKKDLNTVTNRFGGLEKSTIGDLRKKTISEIILDIVTGSEPFGGIQVVDSEENLTDDTIKNPYQGMFVSIKGEPGLWILVGENPLDKSNWTTVSGSGISEDVKKALEEIQDRLGLTESDIDNIKEQIGDFLTSSDLDGYVKIEKLEDYIPKTELDNLAKKSDFDGYVKVEDLDGYLKTEDIADLVKKSDLDGYVRKEDIEGVRKDVEDVKEGLGTLT